VRFGCRCALYCKLDELGIVFMENLVLKHLPERRSWMGFTIFEGPYVEMLVQIYHSESLVRVQFHQSFNILIALVIWTSNYKK
jgi:hypothetical protein